MTLFAVFTARQDTHVVTEAGVYSNRHCVLIMTLWKQTRLVGGWFESLVMVLHWQAPVARRAAAMPAGCHPRVLTGSKSLDAGLMAAAAVWWMGFLAGVTRRRYEEER